MNKLTILALHLGYGGVEKSIASLCNILVDKYEVEVISVYKLYDRPAFNIDKRVKITYLLDTELSPNKEELKAALASKDIVQMFKQSVKSAKILKLKKYEMIKAIKNIKSGIVISTRIEHNKLLSRFGKESLITIAQEHTYHNEDEKYIQNLVKSCENIDYFIPVSQQLTNFYEDYFKNTNTKCMYIPHSLDEIPKEESKLEDLNIISIGRLAQEKGFVDLIDVFKYVHNERPEWKLNIIGDGAEKSNISERIKYHSLQESVVLHGYRDKNYISDQFMKSSIYTMPSYEESFGLVLIESQSYGVPCIAFDSAKGACEIIENNINGYLVSNRSKEEMAKKIIDLIDNVELRKSFGQKSKENSYKYSKENVAKQWFNFLEKLSTY